MSIDMSQFYQVFFEESEEHLAAMESLLLGLDIASPDAEELNAIFRAAHSIKGSSGTFGFTDLTAVTHILETLLDRLRKNEIKLLPEMVDAFLAAGDVLRSMLAGHRGDGAADPEAVAEVCERLQQLAESTAEPSGKGAGESSTAVANAPGSAGTSLPTYDIEFVPTAHAAADPAIIAGLLEELRASGELEILAQPEPGTDVPGFWHVRLSTEGAVEGFGDSIDFIAEQDAWRIREVKSADLEDAGGAFGLFADSADQGASDESFGFFDGAPGAAPPDLVALKDGEGYGFFDIPDPILPPATKTGDNDGDGYGFFAPIPSAEALEGAKAPLPEDGDGFGFFAPLPAAAESASVLATVLPMERPREEASSKNVLQTAATPPSRPAPPAAGRAPAAGESSIRVGVEKVDQLINLVGELVITQAMLLQCAGQMEGNAPERLLQGLGQLERNTRDLQESVMSIRMLPISFVFSRFPRVVRDLSAKLGKQVELKMSGETTELDKSLIERIADPLTHLIRNSLDHGIEMPEKRVAAGKMACGTITLRAAHQGGNIVIEVGDDGGGLHRQKILSKARERGFQVSDQMTDQEVWSLIFEAGFSTADQVTDVSGRGVGMDVVRKNIQAMGGRVEIESMTGVGTRMTVRLPLTLAILDGMSVAVGDQTYILPLSYVVESLQPEPSDVKTLSNQARVIRVRGEYLPVIVLHEIFGIKPASADFTEGIMVILDADGTKAALFVDALVGQHQVVIKSLENNYRRVVGVSGATIMGDGHVALILDVSVLAGMARSAQMAA